MYTLITDPSPAHLEEIYELRVTAWRSNARLRDDRLTRWVDTFDRGAQHWAILFERHVVAAVRLTLHDDLAEIPSAESIRGVVPHDLDIPIASYNRLVVHPDHRGRGLAKALDLVCIKAAKAAGASVLLGATGNVPGNKSRIATMLALGFEVLGPASAPDVDIIADDGLSTVMAYFYISGVRLDGGSPERARGQPAQRDRYRGRSSGKRSTRR